MRALVKLAKMPPEVRTKVIEALAAGRGILLTPKG